MPRRDSTRNDSARVKMNPATEAAAHAYADVLRRRHPNVTWLVVPGERIDLSTADGQIRRTLTSE
jgi:hypothetical protein